MGVKKNYHMTLHDSSLSCIRFFRSHMVIYEIDSGYPDGRRQLSATCVVTDTTGTLKSTTSFQLHFHHSNNQNNPLTWSSSSSSSSLSSYSGAVEETPSYRPSQLDSLSRIPDTIQAVQEELIIPIFQTKEVWDPFHKHKRNKRTFVLPRNKESKTQTIWQRQSRNTCERKRSLPPGWRCRNKKTKEGGDWEIESKILTFLFQV